MKTYDFLIAGGGVVGLSIARELKKRFPDQSVGVLEKEQDCGAHASGRNSGVLHAGFYYTADSLKARFTRQGNRAMTRYCERKGIAINRCGKIVVARGESDLPLIDELLRRAAANGVPLEELTPEQAKKIEPRVKTWKRALFSPSTSTVDPREVMRHMRLDAEAEGIEVMTGNAYLGRGILGVRTTRGLVECGFFVNAAGLYADAVARDWGFSENYRIVPFKGLYLYSDEPAGSIRTNVYPVPDLRNPFLGVHFTVTCDGHAKIGPTAIPAFWREQYGFFENFNASECADIVRREAGLLCSAGFDFRRLALEEIQKYSPARMVRLASELMEGVDPKRYKRWGKPGIRAQLMDVRKKKLEMDFVLEGDENSMHVLNAVSPGFTCSLPFAEYVCDRIEKSTNYRIQVGAI